MKEQLIQYLETQGKKEYESWFDLAKRFKIGEGLTTKKRAKKTQDTWRAYCRNKKENTINQGLAIKKYKVWDGPDGNKRESAEYVATASKNEEKVIKALWDDLKKEALTYMPPKRPKPTYKPSSNNLLEVCIPDLHLGKLAWDKESGENYDINLAKERYHKAIDHFIDLANMPSNIPAKILLVIGNDFFNSDTMHNSTTPHSRNSFRGTSQHEDARWQKTFIEGRKLLIEAIDKLALVAPVDVMVVPGNHDAQRSFYLGDSLESWYRSESSVQIDNSPKSRKYYTYGQNLIGFTHGDKEKLSDLPLIMATECPKAWSESTFREIHLGHRHKEMSSEYSGVLVRTIPSLTGTDAFHFENGYVGNRKSAHTYIWSPSNGMVGMYQFNLI